MPGKKVMLVVPPYKFDSQVYMTLRRAFENAGHKVAVTSVAPDAAFAGKGVYVPVDVRIHDIKYYEYDLFVFIGGEGAVTYFDNEYVIKLCKDVKYKTVAATGNATVILARAEALKNKRATGAPQFAGLLIDAGANFTNEGLEMDGDVYTLKEPLLVEQLASALIKKLNG